MLHQDGSRHVWLEGGPALDLILGSSPRTTLDDATGAIYSAFLVEEEGTASTFRALKEVFGTHGLPMRPLHGPRRITSTRRRPARSTASSRPRLAGRWSNRGSSISAPIRLRRGAAPSRRSRPFRTGWSKSWRWPGSPRAIRPTPSSARFIYPPQPTFRPRGDGARLGLHPDPRRRSPRDPPLRAGGTPGHERQLRLVPHAQIANPGKPDARPFRQGAGPRSTSTPTAPTPSSTAPAASATTTRRERSKMRKMPLKSARRRASWKCGQRDRVAHSPTRQNKTRRSGH
jgi:hypothetical protein